VVPCDGVGLNQILEDCAKLAELPLYFPHVFSTGGELSAGYNQESYPQLNEDLAEPDLL
jgi:hypothetical protein